MQPARLPLAAALALCMLTATSAFAQDGATSLDSIQVSGSWLGTGLLDSVKCFAGARTVVDRQRIEACGAASIGVALRRIP
ncbi:TonB-dependent siderophore receptor, partial [Stenotrophomonas maltophilia]